jgi:hypothetical protein
VYGLQLELGQERAASEALSAERDSAVGRAGESKRLLQGLVGAQADGLKAQGVLESQVRHAGGPAAGAELGVAATALRGGAQGRPARREPRNTE